MAHVLRVVLLVEMRAQEGVLFNINLSFTVYCLHGLLLEVTYRVVVEAFERFLLQRLLSTLGGL